MTKTVSLRRDTVHLPRLSGHRPASVDYTPSTLPDESEGITTLAQDLNRAMADSPAARAAYAAVWGQPWEPLPAV